jgi:RNAse (barnase) inhibitor barstar
LNTGDLKNILSMPNQKAVEVITSSFLDEELLHNLVEALGYQLFRVNGIRIKSKGDLLNDLAQVMDFPDYFGYNWDALEECLRDFEWLPSTKGYILLFTNPEDFIKKAPSDCKTFLEIIFEVSRYWAFKHIRFLLILEPDELFDLSNIIHFE